MIRVLVSNTTGERPLNGNRTTHNRESRITVGIGWEIFQRWIPVCLNKLNLAIDKRALLLFCPHSLPNPYQLNKIILEAAHISVYPLCQQIHNYLYHYHNVFLITSFKISLAKRHSWILYLGETKKYDYKLSRLM